MQLYRLWYVCSYSKTEALTVLAVDLDYTFKTEALHIAIQDTFAWKNMMTV